LNSINRFFVSPAYAVVSAKPSAQLARKLDSDEKKRIAEQVARLGEKGLAEAAKTLEAAQEYNERPIPSDYITSFPLPDVGSIAWIPIQSAVASDLPVDQTIQNDLSKHLASDPSKIPIFSHYNHVKVRLSGMFLLMLNLIFSSFSLTLSLFMHFSQPREFQTN